MAETSKKSEQEQIQEENDSIKRMLQEIPNLKIAQTENAMVSSAIFIKTLKDLVNEKVAKKRKEVKEVASSMLGKNMDAVLEEYHINVPGEENVITKYKDALAQIADVYGDAYKTLLVLMQNLQAEELRATIECKGLKQERNEIKRSIAYIQYAYEEKQLKQKIKKLIDQNLKDADVKLQELQEFSLGNPLNEINEQIKNKIDEILLLQEKIKKCEDKMEEIKEIAQSKIEEYADISEKSIQSTTGEEGFFQKILAFLREGKKQ